MRSVACHGGERAPSEVVKWVPKHVSHRSQSLHSSHALPLLLPTSLMAT
jgi:hypothetical protein